MLTWVWIPPWLRVPEMQEGAAWRCAGDLAEMFPLTKVVFEAI